MPGPLILFAPGAGAPSTSLWMKAWARRLSTLGKVVRFDYPYMKAGRKSPDKPEVLIAAHAEALHKARNKHQGPVVLAGKSMGSRIGCHLALFEPIDALVCLGYPLRSPAGKLRDEVLRSLTTPVLFVQGSRDPLCPLDVLEQVRPRMKARSTLQVVEEGNHSLEVGKRALLSQGKTQRDVDAAVLAAIAAFLNGTLKSPGRRESPKKKKKETRP